MRSLHSIAPERIHRVSDELKRAMISITRNGVHADGSQGPWRFRFRDNGSVEINVGHWIVWEGYSLWNNTRIYPDVRRYDLDKDFDYNWIEPYPK